MEAIVMPAWVSSGLRPAPRDRVIFVRFGAVMFDAGWFRWPGAWFALEPGGARRQIEDPPLWFDMDAHDLTLEEERALFAGQPAEAASPRVRRGPVQLGLNLAADDSQTLSIGPRRA